MTAFATTSDIENVFGPLTPQQTTTAEALLDFASAILRQELPTIDARITAGTLDATLVKYVAVSMTVRVIRNPDGFRSVQEQIEDYAITKTRDSSLSTGGIYLSADELALLSIRGTSGAFSITPHQEPSTYAIEEQIAVHRAWRDR